MEQTIIDWTPERVETLRTMWATGVAVADIAKAIGHEGKRNAVISKAHRLKLPAHPTPPVGAGHSVPRPPRVAVVPRAEREEHANTGSISPRILRAAILPPKAQASSYLQGSAWAPLPGSNPVSLEHRAKNGCAWPVTDTAPHLFCNLPTSEGKLQYCDHHLKRYHSNSEARK